MKYSLKIIDQTVDEALSRGVEPAQLELMINNLQKYLLEIVDISLDHWTGRDLQEISDFLRSWLRCKVRSCQKEIQKARQLGFTRVIISWVHLKENLLLGELPDLLIQVQEFAQEIYLSIENASELSLEEWQLYSSMLEEYKVKRLIYHDKGNVMDMFTLEEHLQKLVRLIPCPLEFCGHNLCGLATANSLAALRAGIGYIVTSVGGVGLAGYAAMEEVLMTVRHLWKEEQVPASFSLAEDCGRILSFMGVNLPVDKSLIGNHIFAHESGIHVDGVDKNPLLYEIIQPEEVGLTRHLIIGKHSGTASLKAKFRQWNLILDKQEAAQLLDKVRKLAVEQKKPLSDLQLQQLYQERKRDSLN